jgi:DNA primase
MLEIQFAINSEPDNPLYHKSRILYGLNWAKAEIVARGEVIVCEGYTDVMAFAPAHPTPCYLRHRFTDDHVRAPRTRVGWCRA